MWCQRGNTQIHGNDDNDNDQQHGYFMWRLRIIILKNNNATDTMNSSSILETSMISVYDIPQTTLTVTMNYCYYEYPTTLHYTTLEFK